MPHLDSARSTTALDGSHVLVIGGSSGIGAAVAQLAKAAGASVTIASRNAQKLEEAKSRLQSDRAVAMDIAVRASVAQAVQALPPVDHLVVTAGRRIAGKLADSDADVLLEAMQERIAGTIYAVQSVLPKLSRGGSITLTSGVLAQRPNAHGTAVLSAAVAGVEALARGLALELAPIRVNAVSPGVIATGLLDDLGEETREGFWRQTAERLPTGRVGQAHEVASAFLQMMSNSFVTGAVLQVDGGGSLV